MYVRFLELFFLDHSKMIENNVLMEKHIGTQMYGNFHHKMWSGYREKLKIMT